jgi:hypothetical protein
MSKIPNANSRELPETLRPIERRVVQLADGGVDTAEIARRFQRSPEFIDRVIEMAELPERGDHAARQSSVDDHPLRPVERCVLGWLDRGAGPAEIGDRLHRSANYVERVEDFARFKLAVR